MIDQKMQKVQGYFSRKITKAQAKDTGMAMVLICLMLNIIFHQEKLLILSVTLLLLNMIWPGAYRPLAVVWLGLSHILGTIMSKVLLSIIFFILVTPVGLFRRLVKADSLMLNKWKNGEESVFKTRNQKYSSKDLEYPY